jgi:hypothetical protein
MGRLIAPTAQVDHIPSKARQIQVNVKLLHKARFQQKMFQVFQMDLDVVVAM